MATDIFAYDPKDPRIKTLIECLKIDINEARLGGVDTGATLQAMMAVVCETVGSQSRMTTKQEMVGYIAACMNRVLG